MNIPIACKVIFGSVAALALSIAIGSQVSAQDADAGDNYAALLQQIENVKLETAQKEIYIKTI